MAISAITKSYSTKIGPWTVTKNMTADEVAKIRLKELENDVYIKGMIPINYFPSVNSMYGHNRWGGKFLLPELYELREQINEYLDQSPLFKSVEIPDEPLRLTLGFFITQGLNRRDYDNMIKFIQDTLADYFNFNDHSIYDGRQFKRLVRNSDTEWLYFKIDKNKSVNGYEIDKSDLMSISI